MPDQYPLVSIVVLNYNGRDFLGPCLESVFQQDYPALEVVVVDNHSTDGSAEWARTTFPRIRLIPLGENFGFCKGNHAGVSAAQGDFVALINNDTVLPPDLIRGLMDSLRANPQAWIAAPRINNRNVDMSLYPQTSALSVSGIIIRNVFQDRTTAFGAPGAAMLFDKKALGLPFDEDYQFFYEDVYVSWRTWLSGHEYAYRSDLVVDHLGGASFRRENNRYAWLVERNRWLTMLIFWHCWTLWRLAPLWALALLSEWTMDLLAGRPLGPRFKAYAWLLGHVGLVCRKRRQMQATRQVTDKKILRLFSCRLTNVENIFSCWLNAVAEIWCRLMGLQTWEIAGGNEHQVVKQGRGRS